MKKKVQEVNVLSRIPSTGRGVSASRRVGESVRIQSGDAAMTAVALRCWRGGFRLRGGGGEALPLTVS